MTIPSPALSPAESGAAERDRLDPAVRAPAWALLVLPMLTAASGVAPGPDRWAAALWLAAGPVLLLMLLRHGEEVSLHALAGLGALSLLSATANARAGVLAIVLPPALAWLGRRSRWLASAALLAAIIGLLFIGSRGGAGAALVGLAVLTIGAAKRPRRALVPVLVALATIPLASLVEVDGEPLWLRGVLEKQADGLSLDSALSGRPAIWQRALFMLEDTWDPLPFALGPGGFESALASYPGAPPVEHAHSWPLHLAVELGVAGVALIFWLIGVATLRLARAFEHARGDEAARTRLAGVAGGLAAFLAFSIADTLVGLHGLLLWPLLALALRSSRPPNRRSGAQPAGLPTGLLAALLTLPSLVALISPPPATRYLARLARIEGRESSDADRRLEAGPAPEDASGGLLWLHGLLAHRLGDEHERERDWRRLVETSPARLALLTELASEERFTDDAALAALATRRWPGSADAWRFRARTTTAEAARIEALERVVALAPRDARSWLELAGLLESRDASAALEAYAAACVRGDPGANACLRGGRLAERSGATIRAKMLYRRSRWPPVRSLAD